jgi:hypothetical protein
MKRQKAGQPEEETPVSEPGKSVFVIMPLAEESDGSGIREIQVVTATGRTESCAKLAPLEVGTLRHKGISQ